MSPILVRFTGIAFTTVMFGVLGGVPALGQATSAPAATQATPASAQAPLKAEELEQMLAPIALYPDQLLAQVLMASTCGAGRVVA